MRRTFAFDTSRWEERLQEEFDKRESKRRRVLSEVPLRLKRYFAGKKVKHVYLVGSLLQEGKFYDFSDVDVAVEALCENPFRTAVELEQTLNRTVDLISMEECRFRDSLLRCAKKIL